jgi:hypothetical protein
MYTYINTHIIHKRYKHIYIYLLFTGAGSAEVVICTNLAQWTSSTSAVGLSSLIRTYICKYVFS